eukprot:TRINITY_DN512_c0_g2_i2.p1 TRINITY_DN512_c0_g2~~TRINITY_DN512_c0_g2_i2.p1  ORF type:complete len:331 (-),score=95.09 TRINITY_DN512_c0_g2_i2:399-1391(-)
MGLQNNSKIVYIIDYGLARKYKDPETGIHIPYRDNKKLTGTARYASLYTHLGIEQSRRDDMECLGYTFIYLLNGRLPWQGIQLDNRQARYNLIKDKKMSMKIEEICKGQPGQFVRYLNYCRGLAYESKPDYDFLRKIFKDLFYEKQYDKNFSLDWVTLSAFGRMNSMDNPNADATNIADCPLRGGGKPKKSGTELKVTEISTPKTIYPQPVISAVPQVSIIKDVLKIPNNMMDSDMKSSVEETKVLDKNNGEADFEKEYDIRQIYTLSRPTPEAGSGTLPPPVTVESNISQTAHLTNEPNISQEALFESHSCNFMEYDIEESSMCLCYGR